jgi:hypothetical protein
MTNPNTKLKKAGYKLASCWNLAGWMQTIACRTKAQESQND